jgi:hypothetical protein
LLALALLIFLIPTSTSAQAGRQVWAFYLGFWTPQGWDERANVLTDYPLERYNSADGNVAARQIEQAQSAGIDAFIVSWFGPQNGQTTAVLNVMLDQAAARGFYVGAAIDVFPDGSNRTREAVIASASYLVYDRANHPAWVRYNGKPVIFFAFQDRTGFTNEQWQEIRNAVDPDHNTYWVSEGLNGCCIHGGAFDAMYAFNIAWGSSSGVNNRNRSATLNAGGSFFVPTVHPGWDEDLIAQLEGRPNPTSVRERANGAFLRGSWNGAVSTGSDVMLVISWNEFMENSHIEPSVNYGSQALDTLRPLVAAWKGIALQGGESIPAEEQSQPAQAPAGVRALHSTTSLNVRAEPNADSERLASISPTETYEILGEQDDFFRIRLSDGREGWVSRFYVVVIEP